MTTDAVRVENLSKTFNYTRAVVDVTFALANGVNTGLVGPNGAGKTTLFSLLCGFLRPTRGNIEVLGYPPHHPALRGRVAILPQLAGFLPGVAVVRQLAILASLQGFSRHQARTEAHRVLDLVRLPAAAAQTPEELSHGMLKRVSIAQAFIGTPELVLLDEPTAGLDPQTAIQIRRVIRQLGGETTFIISSHNLAVIEDLCHDILILDRGKLTYHEDIAGLTGRTQTLTFHLESDPPSDVEALFTALPWITRIEVGQPGQNRLVVRFSGGKEQPVEIEILKCLAGGGIKYREMIRGERLEDKVADMTTGKQ